jgi:hypothetical protein
MSPKAFVREIVDGMSEHASLAEILDQIRLEVSLEQAENDIRAGNLISHEELKARSRDWRKRK